MQFLLPGFSIDYVSESGVDLSSVQPNCLLTFPLVTQCSSLYLKQILATKRASFRSLPRKVLPDKARFPKRGLSSRASSEGAHDVSDRLHPDTHC